MNPGMKQHSQPSKNTETVQPKAENQASVSTILAGYGNPLQHKATEEEEIPVQKKANNTRLPDNLKSGVENLSGIAMDDVKVHYNSSEPAQMQAHAYAQGTDIHIGPGQEKHLPHEAWHVVQQKQGRVKPTMQMKGKVNVNDDTGLETEADVMGAKALQMKPIDNSVINPMQLHSFNLIQRKYKPTDNIIDDRPKETEVIKNAKIAAKAGDDTAEFTAHHKYPWHSIKKDIEKAFTAPKTADTEAELGHLETFSNKALAINQDEFLTSVPERVRIYGANEAGIEEWIREVCWVPANIFIGPLSEKRVDDPSKKDKSLDRDGHYPAARLDRRMSIRSERLNAAGPKGLYNGNDGAIENTVAPYDPADWTKHELGIGTAGPTYSQTKDDYFSNSIFLYNVTSNDKSDFDYKSDTYVLKISTPLDIVISQALYSKQDISNGTTEIANGVLANAPDVKTNNWSITLTTLRKHRISDVKIKLRKASGLTKDIDIDGVNILRPETEDEIRIRKAAKAAKDAKDAKDAEDADPADNGFSIFDQ